MNHFIISWVRFFFTLLKLLAQFIGIKKPRSSIIIVKIKEIELIFRRLLIESNLGSFQVQSPPYKPSNLPIEKIYRICQQINQTSLTYNLRNIQENSLCKELIDLTGKAIKLIRMGSLKSEKEQLQLINNESQVQNGFQEEKSSSEEDEDKDNSSDDDE